MMKEFYSADYDVRVGEIITAHEHILSPGDMWSAFSTRRGFCGFVLVLEGEAFFHSGDHTITLGANQFAFFPADTAYVMEIDRSGAPFRHFTVNFTISDATGFDAVRELFSSTEPHITDLGEHTILRSAFPQLVACWRDKSPGYRMRARELLYGMLYDFISRYLAQKVSPDLLANVMPAKKLIDEHYTEDLTISAMASECGLSETHFRRCFFAAFGMSPIAYRTSLRIERAKDLLLSSYYSIGEISSMTGFSDISFFSRFFTRHTGISPSAYRRKYSDTDVKS